MEIIAEPFIVFGKPDITEKEEKAVINVLRSGWLGNGPVTKELEREFVGHFGIMNLNAIAVNSCTMGLFLCLKSEGIGEGDEVITTPLTFAATVNAILMTGAKPVFVDVDETGSINPKGILNSVTKKTRAIIPVHLWGVPCGMDSIMSIAAKKHLIVIEDAAHAFGGKHFSSPLGTIGHYGVFSFYPTKNIACGDGGMILTSMKDRADKIRVMASQGLSDSAFMRYGKGKVKDYSVELVGFKGLMNDIQSAIVLEQLKRWDYINAYRTCVWDIYSSVFLESYWNNIVGHSKHLFTVRVKNRDKFREDLYKKGIGTGIHYKPLHLEPAYKFLKYKKGDFINAEKIGETVVSLPVSSVMSGDDARRVVKSVEMTLRGL